MESVWGSLKNELVHHRRSATRAKTIAEITEWIEVFYNRQRRHSAIGYLAPAVFARQFYQQQRSAHALRLSTVDRTPHSLGRSHGMRATQE